MDGGLSIHQVSLTGRVWLLLALGLGAGDCAVGEAFQALPVERSAHSPEELQGVDCFLPARLRKLGRFMPNLDVLNPRQAIKTSAHDCGIRGGQWISRTAPLQVWLPLAEAGDSEAQTYVGEIYEKGLGIAPDYKLAAAWYRKAAEQGFARAQFNLGFLYEKGLGVEKDPLQALNWYRQAVEHHGRQ